MSSTVAPVSSFTGSLDATRSIAAALLTDEVEVGDGDEIGDRARDGGDGAEIMVGGEGSGGDDGRLDNIALRFAVADSSSAFERPASGQCKPDPSRRCSAMKRK